MCPNIRCDNRVTAPDSKEVAEVTEFCPTCGAKMLEACPKCGKRLHTFESYLTIRCEGCGAALRINLGKAPLRKLRSPGDLFRFH